MLVPSRTFVSLTLTAMLIGVGPGALAGQLAISTELLQDTYVVGEPLFLNVALSNESGADESVVADISYANQMISAEVRPYDGEWRRIDIGFVYEPSAAKVSLAQGERLVTAQMLAYDHEKSGPLFARPGIWEIRSVYHRFDVIDGDIVSNVASVEVAAPGPADAAGAALFSRPASLQLAHNYVETPQTMADLESFIDKHPDSRFAAYARLFLAQRYLEDMLGRERNPQRAQALLRDLAAMRGAPAQIAQQVLRLSSMASAALGDWQSAIDTSERLNDTAPSRENAQLHDFLVNRREATLAQQDLNAAQKSEATAGDSRTLTVLVALGLPALIGTLVVWKNRRSRT